MATLKDIAVRLRSVKNIQKITASMKMVSTSKFARAERELRVARPYGNGAKAFYDCTDLGSTEVEAKPNTLLVAITSDRGLCGAANSSIVKTIRNMLLANPELNKNTKLVLVGDKSRAQLLRQFRDIFLMSFSDVGKKAPTFEDASEIAESILRSDYKFDRAIMYYNTFKTVVTYITTPQPILSLEEVVAAPKFSLYDSVDEEVLKCYNEYTLASLIFFALKEASTSEQSARMTAMDSATKNAGKCGEMIDKLTLSFNRTRQAAITRELTEIISGAAAVSANKNEDCGHPSRELDNFNILLNHTGSATRASTRFVLPGYPMNRVRPNSFLTLQVDCWNMLGYPGSTSAIYTITGFRVVTTRYSMQIAGRLSENHCWCLVSLTVICLFLALDARTLEKFGERSSVVRILDVQSLGFRCIPKTRIQHPSAVERTARSLFRRRRLQASFISSAAAASCAGVKMRTPDLAIDKLADSDLKQPSEISFGQCVF
ncbi:F-type H+-transporting ATPase subunit gamma [Clonorchis sinensis]|uniref:F-ATPase gamma subunit n=1 Tax=Clonorchis sinensis TaxID=79923 RepID=G7YBN3_CLOSI|nr:F-type H+-transporting ATPase subunit gamma [Clonorchis sinensis]